MIFGHFVITLCIKDLFVSVILRMKIVNHSFTSTGQSLGDYLKLVRFVRVDNFKDGNR